MTAAFNTARCLQHGTVPRSCISLWCEQRLSEQRAWCRAVCYRVLCVVVLLLCVVVRACCVVVQLLRMVVRVVVQVPLISFSSWASRT